MSESMTLIRRRPVYYDGGIDADELEALPPGSRVWLLEVRIPKGRWLIMGTYDTEAGATYVGQGLSRHRVEFRVTGGTTSHSPSRS